jgi:hypothetical protein
MKILKGRFNPIPSHYTSSLREMTEALLLKDHRKRPSLNDLFKMSSMKERMKMFGYSFDDHLAEIGRSKGGG